MFVCTGSQGEPRAALRRIAAGNHKNIKFGEGDTVIFSSRIIPGNELPISRLHNQLVTRGIEVISTNNDEVHVSGHPAQEELIEMYQFIRPEISVPVHGEQRHLKKHCRRLKTLTSKPIPCLSACHICLPCHSQGFLKKHFLISP